VCCQHPHRAIDQFTVQPVAGAAWIALARGLARRYRLQDRIAVGGAGEVWRAADAVLGRAVAVKLLRPEYAGNGEMLARFRAEARYATLVCHRGVVPVYD
jgi:serine/threonine protein kinase